MKVKIEYYDNESFTVEEIVKQVEHLHGKQARIEISPESTLAYDHIYFGIQQLVTHGQLALLFNSGETYQQDLKKLRSDVVFKISEILDQVIIDNESKIK